MEPVRVEAHRISPVCKLAIFVALVVSAVLLAGAAPAAATTVVRNKTFTDFRIRAGAHDIVYEDCVFTGGATGVSVLRVDQACHDITFRRCEIRSGAWNGVSVNDHYGNVRNITFYRCRIRPQARMGFECTTRPITAASGYTGIRIVRCVFDPQGSEAISFDGGPACQGRVSGTIVRGAGTNPDFPWGQGIEVNRVGRFRFFNNSVYQCRGAMLNLQWDSTAACGWDFHDNRLDASVHKQTVPMDNEAQVVCAMGVRGGEFHYNTVIGSSPGGGVAWFGDCHDMDWRWNKWLDSRRGSWQQPMEQLGCTGNLF